MKTQLKEAPLKVTIDVTQDDIDKGKKGEPTTCAIARAIKRTMGDHPNVEDEIQITIQGQEYYYNIPKKASTFIERFDMDKKRVKPMSFVAKLHKERF